MKSSVALLVYIAGLAWVLFFVLPEQIIGHLGFISAASSVVMFAAYVCILFFFLWQKNSPLSNIVLVIRTRNADSIPLIPSIANTLCTGSWWYVLFDVYFFHQFFLDRLYGSMISDNFISFPNSLGFGFSLVMLLLKLIYRNSSSNKNNIFSLLPTTVAQKE